jgi:hypothetical protein
VNHVDLAGLETELVKLRDELETMERWVATRQPRKPFDILRWIESGLALLFAGAVGFVVGIVAATISIFIP